MNPQCRRCNNLLSGSVCNRCEQIPYSKKWWKFGPDIWPSGSICYVIGNSSKEVRVVNCTGENFNSLVEVNVRNWMGGFSEEVSTYKREQLALANLPN